MGNQGKGRSNYRVDSAGVVPAKGYGARSYSRVRVLWAAADPDDPGFADALFDEAPISHESLQALIAGLNSGTIPDRFSS